MSDGVGLRSERGPILLALMLSTFLIAIDSTVLSTAVPTIVAEFGGFEQFAWLFSIYMLAQAASVPVYAKLSDIIGRRPVIYIGIVLFLIGSVLCASAWSMGSLIAFRAVQGLGAGAILPTTMTIAGDIYTVRERARTQGYLASVWAFSSVAGPTLGGLFSQFLSWRWIFWINVPLCLLALWMLWRNYRQPYERHRRPIDYAGALLLTAALVLIVLALLEGGNGWAWMSWQSLGAFGLGAVLLIAFAFVERRAEDPILAPWVFSSRIVVSTSVVSLLRRCRPDRPRVVRSDLPPVHGERRAAGRGTRGGGADARLADLSRLRGALLPAHRIPRDDAHRQRARDHRRGHAHRVRLLAVHSPHRGRVLRRRARDWASSPPRASSPRSHPSTCAGAASCRARTCSRDRSAARSASPCSGRWRTR